MYATSGIIVKCIQPMRQWSINFDGKMKLNRQHLVDVRMRMQWHNIGEHFDFDTDSSPVAIARAIARESWSAEMFRRLRESHQTHYEQFGMCMCLFSFHFCK